MTAFDLALAFLASPWLPAAGRRAVIRLVVAFLRRRQEQDAAPPAHPAPAGPLYLVDGYHGGVVFWDWLALPGGGLWYLYNWPACLQPALDRALRDARFRVTLDLDAFTYEEMARQAPTAIQQLRQAIQLGRLEVVNGTYAQPLAQSTSGESFVRQLWHGLDAIRRVLDTGVTVFYSQEPAYFPQLPQILRGFGFQGVIWRTQWAAFGTDPATDAAVVRWQGPDGSIIPAVPRYTFQRYDRLRAEHPGLPHMALAAGERADWEPASLAPFEQAARERGIAAPLVTDLKDPNLPDAPLPHAMTIAATENVHFVTPTAYLRQVVGAAGPLVSYTPDGIPSTLPWGLQGEMLIRARVAAESALLVAERLDAIAHLLGEVGAEEKLAGAWKHLCLAQHHDLHVCGPWHSRRHNRSLAEVGVEYATQARQTAGAVTQAVLDRLAGEVSGDVLVFNPSFWPRRDYVEVQVAGTRPDPHGLTLTDGEEEIPCQVIRAGTAAVTLGFVLDLPGFGYRVLRWAARPATPGPASFHNPWYEATVHPDGSLSLIVAGRPLVTEGNYLTVWRDGAWHDSRQGVRRVELTEDGPVYRRYRITGEIAGVPFGQTLTLYRGLPRMDGSVVLDCRPGGVYLGPQMADDRPGQAMMIQDEKKLCLAFNSPLNRVWSDSPFLIAETRQERFVGLHGAGLEDGSGTGVALLNHGTPGYHFDPRAGILRNVLAWGPREWVYASDDSVTRGRSRYTALRGPYRYEYAILPYTWRLDAHRAALDLRLPYHSRAVSDSASRWPAQATFLTVEPAEVLATALFVHHGRAYLRLWNGGDREITASVRGLDEVEVQPVNLQFADEGLPSAGGVPLRPWGIQTVAVPLRFPRAPAHPVA